MMIVVAIILFTILIVVHELGHFWAARRNGVEVEEFGIGFPPRLFGRQYKDTLYSINLLPLGGFVKLKGESDSDRREGSMGAASLWAKTKILLAGVGMNLVAAYVIVLALAWTQLPVVIPEQYTVPADEATAQDAVVVVDVVEDSAAAAAGLQSGDELRTLQGEDVTSAEVFIDDVAELAPATVEIEILRDNEPLLKTAELEEAENGAGVLGLQPFDFESKRYTWSAPMVALGVTAQMVGLVFEALGQIGSGLAGGDPGQAADQVAGPVGIVAIIQSLGDLGPAYILFLMASISVPLAVINALPIPALDGGRLAVILGARALRKQLSENVEAAIHGIGFLALIGLLILITYVDIQRFF